MGKNEQITLSDIYHAIRTCQAARGDVQAYGIANAFVREMRANKNCLVLFQKKFQSGGESKSFVMMKSKTGQKLFPLFTDMTKILPVKAELDKRGDMEIGVMNLRGLLKTLDAHRTCDGIIVNPYMQNFNAPLSFFTDMLRRDLRSHVTLIEADLTALYTNAVMCPADETISGTGVVDAVIQKTGGDVFKKAIQDERGEEMLGTADVIVVEGQGELLPKYVFFTGLPAYTKEMSVETIYECYLNCLNAAKELKCKSIAFPCSVDAMKGIPKEMLIGASTHAVTTWLAKNPDFPIDVYFCCTNAEDKADYQKFFDALRK